MSMQIKAGGCHPTCVQVTGAEHETEVNTSEDTGRQLVECSTCGTVLRVFDKYSDAIALAIKHAFNPEVKT